MAPKPSSTARGDTGRRSSAKRDCSVACAGIGRQRLCSSPEVALTCRMMGHSLQLSGPFLCEYHKSCGFQELYKAFLLLFDFEEELSVRVAQIGKE